jgi:PAS domain S-box-containing protein
VNEASVARIVLVGVDPELQSQLTSWVSNLSVDVETVADESALLESIPDDQRVLYSVIIGTAIEEPVRLAQRIHRIEREIALLILSEEFNESKVSRALQFTPFLGDYVTSHVRTSIDEIGARLYETVRFARQRRQFRTTIASMNEQLNSIPSRRISAVQYLDRVLDHAPIGVIALDSNGFILSSNQRAGLILEQSERDLLGAALVNVFPAAQRQELHEALEQISGQRVSEVTEVFARSAANGSEQFVAVTATSLPVEPGERGLLVILQDVTTQVVNEREREAALRLRDDFLSMAAHELRTPLTSVKGFVDLLGRRIYQGDWDRTRITRLQDQLSSQVDRLELLVGDLLDISRIQHGHLDPNFASFDLAELARTVVKRFVDDPHEWKDHTLLVDAPSPVNGVWDRERLDQVLTNLISNAFKYSPEGSRIDVSIRETDGGVDIVVEDEGYGIDTELKSNLFQPFQRGKYGGVVPGTGLGLHITYRIVEQHGGSISVESAPGEGSTFIVHLPLDSRQAVPAQSIADLPQPGIA